MPPWWFVLILVFTTIPLLAYPWLMTRIELVTMIGMDVDVLRLLLYAMPVYVLITQWVCYHIYVERKLLAWVLQLLLLLVYLGCMWLLSFGQYT